MAVRNANTEIRILAINVDARETKLRLIQWLFGAGVALAGVIIGLVA